jgi:hypothetical protein
MKLALKALSKVPGFFSKNQAFVIFISHSTNNLESI